MKKIIPVILSGGSGTRLWPLSRALYPKQLHQLYSDNSMLQETAKRVCGESFGAPIIICNDEHRFIIAEQLLEAGIKPHAIVLEPVGRNTAPAAAIAALIIAKEDPDALMLLLPSDHMIANEEAFCRAVSIAAEASSSGALVALGIAPDVAETGYGYIRRGPPTDGVEGCFSVDHFVEKPDAPTAEIYVSSGEYLWNSGMFMFSVSQYLNELSALQPIMVDHCKQAILNGVHDLDFMRLDEAQFSKVKPDSIDYALMEHTDHAAVVPVDMGWNDVGSWSSLWEVSEKDSDENVLHGDVIALDVNRSYIRTSGPLVATIGLSDLVVVCTDDAVLIAPQDRAQQVKNIVDRLKMDKREEANIHSRVYRPWGWYQTIDSGVGFQAKQLMVKPGAVLSLQRHQHRAEHWVVVDGIARVSKDGEIFDLTINQSTYIPQGIKHRLENVGSEALRIIEVQTGSYLGEDDIERLEDVYGR